MGFLGVPIEAGPAWSWLVDWIPKQVFGAAPELGIDSIAVTQEYVISYNDCCGKNLPTTIATVEL